MKGRDTYGPNFPGSIIGHKAGGQWDIFGSLYVWRSIPYFFGILSPDYRVKLFCRQRLFGINGFLIFINFWH